MNPEMQTTLLDTCPPNLIATTLKAHREQFKENAQLNAVEEIAGPAPEIFLEYDQIRAHSEGVYEIVPMQECKGAGQKLLELIWVDTDKTVDPAQKKLRSRLCAREYKTKKHGNIQRALFASQLFCAMPPFEAVKALVSTMMSVSWSNKGKPLKLRHYDISRAHFHGTAHRLVFIRLLAEDRQTYG